MHFATLHDTLHASIDDVADGNINSARLPTKNLPLLEKIILLLVENCQKFMLIIIKK